MHHCYLRLCIFDNEGAEKLIWVELMMWQCHADIEDEMASGENGVHRDLTCAMCPWILDILRVPGGGFY